MKATHLMAVTLALFACAAQAQAPAPANRPEEEGKSIATGSWGKNYTPGWALMTAKERRDAKTKMLSVKTLDDCKAAVEQTRQAMAARAKEKNLAEPPAPPKDACAKLKK